MTEQISSGGRFGTHQSNLRVCSLYCCLSDKPLLLIRKLQIYLLFEFRSANFDASKLSLLEMIATKEN